MREEISTACKLYRQALATAAETDFRPLVNSVLFHAGELVCSRGDSVVGLQAMMKVLEHTDASFEVKQQASHALACRRADMKVDEYRCAFDLTKAANLTDTIQALADQLASLSQADKSSS